MFQVGSTSAHAITAMAPRRLGSVSKMNELSILVVEIYPIIRHGLRALLEAQPGWKICGEAATGQAALQKVKRLKPDIVLLDLDLPDMQGLEIIPRIIEIHPKAGILAWTEHESLAIASRAITSGARGLVLKSDGLRDVIQGVEALARGESFRSLRAGTLMKDGPDGGAGNLRATLTSRELQILKLLADGKTNKQVAAALDVSVRTVEAHRASVMKKLELRSLSDLIHFAIRHRIVGI
jgi:DNA-binding NarL/FixJ family response regulator